MRFKAHRCVRETVRLSGDSAKSPTIGRILLAKSAHRSTTVSVAVSVVNAISGTVRVEQGSSSSTRCCLRTSSPSRNAHLNRCIVDKHAMIPAGERIGFDRRIDATGVAVSDGGIVVIPHGYCFSAGTSGQPHRALWLGIRVAQVGVWIICPPRTPS